RQLRDESVSMNMTLLENRSHQLRRKIRRVTELKHPLLSASNGLDRLGKPFYGIMRDDDCPMVISVHNLIMLSVHSQNLDWLPEFDKMNMSMTGGEAAPEHTESFCPCLDVAEGSVCNAPSRAEGEMNFRMNFAPERSSTRLLVQILQDNN